MELLLLLKMYRVLISIVVCAVCRWPQIRTRLFLGWRPRILKRCLLQPLLQHPALQVLCVLSHLALASLTLCSWPALFGLVPVEQDLPRQPPLAVLSSHGPASNAASYSCPLRWPAGQNALLLSIWLPQSP